MGSQARDASLCRRRNGVIFVGIAVAWLLLDQVTKRFVETFELGASIGGPYLGLVDLTLVHNTGGAWGILEDMTIILAVLSIVVCIGAIAYVFVLVPDSSPLTTVGLALVVAGGIGNAIDRLSNMYVIDFIRPVFIDFPVFNIADIGVTCGCAIFLISLVLDWARQPKGAST